MGRAGGEGWTLIVAPAINAGISPLAFLSPRITAAIVDGTAPADLTVATLAKALPYSWAEQEQTSVAPATHSLIAAA